MKKLLGIALTLASIGIAAPAAEAKTNTPAASAAAATAAQWGNRGRWDRRPRVTTQTRLVRVGRRVYRETYQVRYFPNGRVQTRLISRVRIR
jgi:hypothetical protein